MTARRRDPNRCRVCGSDNVWSNFFDADGLAVNDDRNGATWNTVCQDCGSFHDPLPEPEWTS